MFQLSISWWDQFCTYWCTAHDSSNHVYSKCSSCTFLSCFTLSVSNFITISIFLNWWLWQEHAVCDKKLIAENIAWQHYICFVVGIIIITIQHLINTWWSLVKLSCQVGWSSVRPAYLYGFPYQLIVYGSWVSPFGLVLSSAELETASPLLHVPSPVLSTFTSVLTSWCLEEEI